MLTAMHRKLLRDLLHTKGQAIAIAMVLACGVTMFVMWLSALNSLTLTQELYNQEYRFAHVFAHLKRAPKSLVPRIAELPGVASVQTRVVSQVNLDLPNLDDPATGRVISIPERQRPMLNDLHLRSGRWIEPGRRGEIILSEPLAETHGFKSGDRIRAVMNGRLRTLTIVGIALSPEYVYEIREGDLVPDNRRFGVLWMGETELAAAFDLEGAFNSIALTLLPGANEQEVIKRLDLLTAPYGGLGAYGRDDQTSHRYLSGEIEQLRVMAVIAPTIFFAVAAFLLNMVLTRMISTQREQIAALKSFGYSRWEIGWHYLQYVFLIAMLGVAIGLAAGVWLGRFMTDLYAQFFRFPDFEYVLDIRVVAPTLFVSLAVASAGAMTAVWRAVKLPPAEAMRPEPPPEYRATVIERIGLQTYLAQSSRMILRHLERQPVCALLTLIGIALAASVLILGSFTSDIVDYMIDFEFHRSQRQDVTVTFTEPVSGRSERELNHMPGVLHAEGFRAIPARIRSAHREERIVIMGLEPDRALTRLMDEDEREIAIPEQGVLLADKLAELLNVTVGDVVTVEVMERDRPVRQVHVAGIVRQFTGQGAWMSRAAAQSLMREQDQLSGAHLAVDPSQASELYRVLKETPAVAGVTLKRVALDTMLDEMAETMLRIRFFNIIFATIIAFGVVYNSARITFAERGHELATLRVIGFTRREVSAILLGELAVLTLLAIPIGLLIGYGFAVFTIEALDTEEQRFPMVIYPATYGMAALTVLIAAILSGLVVRRRVDHLDMIAVLRVQG